jgi:hypothetical protein
VVKLRKIGDSFIVSIPPLKIAKKRWKLGQLFDWEEDGMGNLVLVPVKSGE